MDAFTASSLDAIKAGSGTSPLKGENWAASEAVGAVFAAKKFIGFVNQLLAPGVL